MEDNLNLAEAKGLGSVSWISVIVTYIIAGFLFLSLTVPLLLHRHAVQKRDSFWVLLGDVGKRWTDMFGRDLRTTTFLIYVLIALVIGFTILPFGLQVAEWAGQAWTFLMRKAFPGKEIPNSFKSIGLQKEHADFLMWLHSSRAARNAWEWTYFNYYLAVAIWLNTLATALTLSYVSQCTVPGIIIALILFLYTWGHMYMRGLVLQRQFEHYLQTKALPIKSGLC